MADSARTRRRRRLALVFGIGTAWIALVSWSAHSVSGDDDWSWVETAVRSATGGLAALTIAAVIPPRRLRAVQRPLASAIQRGELPRDVDLVLWRAALDHHRSALWVWRWLFPVLLGGSALVCGIAAFFLSDGSLAAVLGLGLCFTAAAVGCRIFAEQRRVALDRVQADLGERGERGG